MIHIYDFEVFKYDWLVVILDVEHQTYTRIVNDVKALREYHNEHQNEVWVGYNSRRYDQYILKAILCGFNAYDMNKHIINDKNHGFQYSSLLREIKLINYDVYLINDGGLKTLEAFMGNAITETSIPFDIDRKLTFDEINEVFEYCQYDVEQTFYVFIKRKEEFEASIALINIFDLPLEMISKTKAQLVAKICQGISRHYAGDEFEFELVPDLKLGKYEHIGKWFFDKENHDYSKSQIEIIGGIPHTIAWGGLHGALGVISRNKNDKVSIKSTPYHGKGMFLSIDVEAYYPSMQLLHHFGMRNMGKPENFKFIHDENLRLKKIDKKKRFPFKIADNSISGQLKDKYSCLYDPKDNNSICINGQLMLIDLIDKVENYGELIQSNTDGIIIKINPKDYEKIDDIVYEWEMRHKLKMEFDNVKEIYQKDVNNYIVILENNKYKSKGAYVKQLSELDNDLPIVNKALINFLTKKIPIEETINNEISLLMFQKVIKLTGKYDYVLHDGITYTLKCYRVFASLSSTSGRIMKVKNEGNPEKFANTPEQCFIDNGNVNDKKVPQYLDKEWYIDVAYDRLLKFGVTKD